MIDPPPASSMYGIAARAPKIGPFTFTASVRSIRSSVTSWNTVGRFTPALLKTTSTLPHRSTVPSVYARTWTSSETSAGAANAASPISAAVDRTASSFRSTHVTRAPSSAKRIALARPIPDPAPVTMQTFPASRSPITITPSTSAAVYGGSRSPSEGKRSETNTNVRA